MNNTAWVAVDGSNNTFVMTLACPVGKTALSAGMEGGGALNNLITMRVDPENPGRGLFRIRTQAGSTATEVTAQLVCATLGG